MAKPLFKNKSHWDLINLLRQIFDNNAISPNGETTSIYEEMHANLNRVCETSQIRRLNKYDLIQIIYAILMPEIKRIDEAPLDELPLLLNEKWTTPELIERIKDRLREGK